MRDHSNGIARGPITGVGLGLLGVACFSFSLPATTLALDGFDPWLVGVGRAAGAGLLAIVYLLAARAPRPAANHWPRLAVVALGVVFGFPICTTLALLTSTSAHGAVVIAVLPAMTAVFAVLRGGERPPAAFWGASLAGLVAVLGFLIAGGGIGGGLHTADLLLIGAVLLVALGYAEGGALARELGGARTICWALVLSLPVTIPVAGVSLALHPVGTPSGSAWFGLGYVTVVSMFLGFFAWYAGLAAGGVARVGQVQLIQPVLTLGWSALLLGEEVNGLTMATAALVLLCVLLTQRTRTARPLAMGLTQ
ncbi:drug/metabolite transporter (DMT)-like permease [Catenuloplanes nepalensis]|uniref:Drug/metabolite transporter (DMT)-like permease n=1 Tax=Catenuloplanes nepalensis TaxID=587533 RepID=A0ABT9N5T1_9ACTN|nr:DMT family transporter [Catenuloplanes nepalensis]MDP9799057.1 drug/metabolite transporter (DMT)-like permease [Catenuloplanes nepalensis]